VLLQRRHAQMTDMGGLYVFPGGKLDPHRTRTHRAWPRSTKPPKRCTHTWANPI
jgi:hypothetical protein